MKTTEWSYLHEYGDVFRVTGLSLSKSRRAQLRAELVRHALKNHVLIFGSLFEEPTRFFGDRNATYPDLVFEHPTVGRWIIGDMGIDSQVLRIVKRVIRKFEELRITKIREHKR